jgi:tetratricopeptide (TPR) repeat protein
MTTGHLADLAQAIADGAPIDWDGVCPSVSLRFVVPARIVERIAQIHASLPSAESFTASLHHSLLGMILPGDADAPTDAPITWGPLVIVAQIGRGTFGDVYRAHDARLDRPVALKLLRRKDRRELAVIEEGHRMARVRHPNVVTVYGAERIDGRVGLWMELVEGQTLEQELRDRGPFPSAEVTRIGVDLARAVAAVHRAGLLHRDLKAQNVMRDRDGRILLTDFGAGREWSGESGDAGHELAGTPLYLAPEILAGQPASPASDIYALGVLLYHLATGSFPVRGRSIVELREAHAAGAANSTLATEPRVNRAMGIAIDRALAREPGQRFASPEAFERALTSAARPPRRIRWLAGVGVTAGIVAVGAIGLQVRRTLEVRTSAATATRPHRSFDDVTTSSKEALRYYLEANDAAEQGQWPASYDLTREAIRLDPQFASAEIWMAWSAWHLGSVTRRSEISAHAERAMALVDRASVWEQDWIRASYDGFNDRFADAIAPLEALLRLKPDHFWAAANLAVACKVEHRRGDAIPFVTRAAHLLPDNFDINVTAAEMLVVDTGDATSALPFVRAAMSATPHAPDALVRLDVDWLYYFPVFERWVNGDIDTAARLFEEAVRRIEERPARERERLYDGGGAFAQTLGQLDRTRELFAHLPGAVEGARELRQSGVAMEAGHRDEAIVLLRHALQRMNAGAAYLLGAIRLGLVDDVQRHIRAMEAFVAQNPALATILIKREQLAAVKGELMLRQGNPAAAVPLLEQAVRMQTHTGSGNGYFFESSESLAEALTMTGRTVEAIQVLELAGLEKATTYPRQRGSNGKFWIASQARLVDLYHAVGREADESALRSELLSYLKYSDPTHPIRLQLERSAKAHRR